MKSKFDSSIVISIHFCSLCWVPPYLNNFFEFRTWIPNCTYCKVGKTVVRLQNTSTLWANIILYHFYVNLHNVRFDFIAPVCIVIEVWLLSHDSRTSKNSSFFSKRSKVKCINKSTCSNCQKVTFLTHTLLLQFIFTSATFIFMALCKQNMSSFSRLWF